MSKHLQSATNKTFSYALMLCLCLFLASCGGEKSGDNSANTSTSNETDKENPDETGKPNTPQLDFESTVNGLRLREKPNTDAKVVTQVDEGAALKNLGEKTDFTEKITLRGVEHDKPWYKVEAPDGKQGWVFGGAVRESMTQQGAGGGFSQAELQSFFDGLDPADCKNIRKAIEETKKQLSNSGLQNNKAADQALDAFRDFVIKAVEKADAKMQNMPVENGTQLYVYNPDKKPIPSKIKQQFDEWDACGLSYLMPEGMLMMVSKPGLFADNFRGFGTPAMQEYLKQEKKENQEGYAEDAGLTVDAQVLAERAVFWEKFSKKHPKDFIYAENAVALGKNYFGTLMSGLDNTPNVDFESYKLLPEFEKAYKWIIDNHGNTDYGKKMKDYYALYKKNDMKRGKEAEQFMQDYWEE